MRHGAVPLLLVGFGLTLGLSPATTASDATPESCPVTTEAENQAIAPGTKRSSTVVTHRYSMRFSPLKSFTTRPVSTRRRWMPPA